MDSDKEERLKQKYSKMLDEHISDCQRCNDSINALDTFLESGVTEHQVRNGLANYTEQNPGHNKFMCPDLPDFPEEE